MSAKELVIEDSYGRKLHFSTFAGQIVVVPIVERIGDAITIAEEQAKWLKLWLAEHAT